MRIFKLVTLATLPLLSTPVMAQDAQLKDLTIEQANVAQAATSRLGSLQVSLSTDRADATYAIGEAVRLMLTANEDAYVTVLDVGPTGQVTQLFPNQYQTDNHVFANSPVEIGGGNSGARVTVAGPVGAELLEVIASSKPVTVVSESQLQGRGVFRTVNGGAQTVMRDLQVTADQAAQSDTRIALANVPLRTTGSRAVAAPALIIVPAQTPAPQPAAAATLMPVAFPQPQAPAPSLVSIPAQQPFPLLIALDRPSYRIGDRITLAVTAVQACNLTVLDFTTSGQVRTLFPNPATPSNAVGAMQTVLVAGGPSAMALPVSGPGGVEQVVAVCSTDGALATPAAFSADRAAAVRDLTVVAARPAGATAMASASFTVQP